MSYLPTDGFPETTADLSADPNSVTNLKHVTKPASEEKDEVVLSPEELEEQLFLSPPSTAADGAAALPISPLPLVKNQVYGTYLGALGNYEIELRVDIDGKVPLKKVSGDFFAISGLTKTYFGSFIADGVLINTTTTLITITGTANTTWTTPYNKIKITIKRTTLLQPLAAAQLQWIHGTTGAAGATYTCNFSKRGFRSIRLEQDCTAGVIPFVSYSTGSLPSGGPARVLSINTAYNEAGVDMLNAGIANVVPIGLAGTDAKWTNAELHNAMVNHFSLYQEKPMWDVWLLHAHEHINGPGLYGIMFDQQGLNRQGCAVFYKGIGGATPEQKRLQLYTCVHELGHCFNLLHSWQKSYASPPKPNIPNSLSWMNYPWSYPGGGAAGFWNAFPFQFDPVELAHIRHGFRNNVIMGGNPFAVGASLDDIAALFEDNIENNAGLELELEAKATYLLGEPVVLETKLKTTSFKNKSVISSLHADYGFVTIGIKKPGGQVVVYEPLAEMCIVPERTVLNATNPGVYESSYIGFGKDGFIFDQVGNYQIKAVYYHEDGSRIVSDTLTIRVRSPYNEQDDAVAELMMTEEVGYLLKFMGSDAPYLQKGNDALHLVEERYRNHPLAVYAEFVKGMNAQRTFKTILPDKKLMVREPDFKEGIAELTDVVEKSKAGEGLDNITLNLTMQTLAKTYKREGNIEAAEVVVKDMVAHFDAQPIKQSVKEQIHKDAALTLLQA